jgi:hypothetical protein
VIPVSAIIVIFVVILAIDDGKFLGRHAEELGPVDLHGLLAELVLDAHAPLLVMIPVLDLVTR